MKVGDRFFVSMRQRPNGELFGPYGGVEVVYYLRIVVVGDWVEEVTECVSIAAGNPQQINFHLSSLGCEGNQLCDREEACAGKNR